MFARIGFSDTIGLVSMEVKLDPINQVFSCDSEMFPWCFFVFSVPHQFRPHLNAISFTALLRVGDKLLPGKASMTIFFYNT